MKRVFAMLLALLMLLCACGSQPEILETTVPETVDTTAPETTGPTEPPRPDYGLYDHGSTVEVLTGGAVKKFLLEDREDYYAVVPMGEALLLFSGENETTLTLLSETAEPVSATVSGCYLYPDDTTVQVTDEYIGYYDGAGAVVILDGALQEKYRVSLPEQRQGSPVLSADLKYAYYFDSDYLWCLEVETGISRYLKECGFAYQEALCLHFDDSVLECCVSDGETEESLFVSTANGETLFMSQTVPFLYTDGDQYIAEWKEGIVSQRIFGARGGAKSCIEPLAADYLEPLPALNGLAACSTDTTGSTIDYYELEQGSRSASVRLSGIGSPWSLEADPSGERIWFLAEDLWDPGISLYCWEPGLSPTGDGTSYASPYYTVLEPDTDGLSACTQTARELGDRFGLRIRVWEDALLAAPEEYNLELEYMVPVYEHYLSVLEQALARYPEGFFETLGDSSDNGILTISLVRSIHGSNELGSLDSVDGVHFWLDGSGYVTLALGDVLEQTVYHEVFHAIDSYILTEYLAYDDWEQLNPSGFEYDQSYIANQYREDDQYLQDDTRAFIDMYSMSYPKEDRARIMEYAMMDGNEAYFTSDAMQAKLRMLCQGIRKAFGLEEYTEALPWEQYLN